LGDWSDPDGISEEMASDLFDSDCRAADEAHNLRASKILKSCFTGGNRNKAKKLRKIRVGDVPKQFDMGVESFAIRQAKRRKFKKFKTESYAVEAALRDKILDWAGWEPEKDGEDIIDAFAEKCNAQFAKYWTKDDCTFKNKLVRQTPLD